MSPTPAEQVIASRALEAALALEAQGIRPSVPEILFAKGIFKDRAEFDECMRTAAVGTPHEIARQKPARKPRRTKGPQ